MSSPFTQIGLIQVEEETCCFLTGLSSQKSFNLDWGGFMGETIEEFTDCV